MKKIIALLLVIVMCLTVLAGCTDGTVSPNGGEEENANKLLSVNEDGQLIANRGTVTVDGVIDEVWNTVEAVPLEQLDRYYVPASATVKVLWDDTNLYVLAEISDVDINSAEDCIEIYLDPLWDKSNTYQDDDIRIKAKAGATASDTEVYGAEGSAACYVTTNDSGYCVEAAILLKDSLFSDNVLGFDIRMTDCDASGTVKGRANLFDRTDSVDDDPSAFGELVLEGESANAVSLARVAKLIERLESKDITVYGGYESVNAKIRNLKALLEKSSVTAKEVNEAMIDTHKAYDNLVDATDFPAVADIAVTNEVPDPFIMLDGTEMKTAADWEARRKEISDMYQYYMYGVWRDGSDEIVTYDYNNGTLTVYIERISTGAKTQFTATVMLPDSSVKAPSDAGYPVVVGMHAGISEETANKNGFATITLDWFAYGIASDDTKRTGAFYDLYPYGDTWQEQTGVLMAWSWGCSKILDALEAGLGEELNIDGTNSIVTGVSRWGKAASVAGAFEPRFKMAAPSCSGAGGLALFRYMSKGNTYDFSTKGAASAYTYGDNEPLGSLQSAGEVGWFNNTFKQFKSAEHLPFDQYMLASLIADEDRYLFIIGSCIYEDWVNAPAMWYTYLASKQIYDYLGVGDNIKINIHKEGHAVIEEDMQYMTEYFKYMVYGIEPQSDLSVLDTSVFALEENVDHEMDDFTDDWIINYMLD